MPPAAGPGCTRRGTTRLSHQESTRFCVFATWVASFFCASCRDAAGGCGWSVLRLLEAQPAPGVLSLLLRETLLPPHPMLTSSMSELGGRQALVVPLAALLPPTTHIPEGSQHCLSRAGMYSVVLHSSTPLGPAVHPASPHSTLPPSIQVSPPLEREQLVNWSGTHEVTVRELYQPESMRELEALVAQAHREGA